MYDILLCFFDAFLQTKFSKRLLAKAISLSFLKSWRRFTKLSSFLILSYSTYSEPGNITVDLRKLNLFRK